MRKNGRIKKLAVAKETIANLAAKYVSGGATETAPVVCTHTARLTCFNTACEGDTETWPNTDISCNPWCILI